MSGHGGTSAIPIFSDRASSVLSSPPAVIPIPAAYAPVASSTASSGVSQNPTPSQSQSKKRSKPQVFEEEDYTDDDASRGPKSKKRSKASKGFEAEVTNGGDAFGAPKKQAKKVNKAKKPAAGRKSKVGEGDVVADADATETPESYKRGKARAVENQDPAGEKVTKAPTKKGKKAVNPADRKRKAPVTKAPLRAIPRAPHECDEADRTLLAMRDAETSWPEIRKAWERITGEKVGDSTLPNRYKRLKEQFVVIKEEDQALLLEGKVLVETKFERQKWGIVATHINERGGELYDPFTLRVQFKKMMDRMEVMPPSGIRDKDFEEPVMDEGE